MRWWLLLLIPMVSAQALPATLQDVTYEHSVETWKSGPQDDLEALGPWHASLGTSAMLTFALEGDADWTYEGTLSDGTTTVEGVPGPWDQTLLETITTGASAGVTLRFDVDGQRALVDRGAIPPLVPGTWRYRIAAEDAQGNPVGFATGTIETDAVQFDGVLGSNGWLPGMSVPENVLPNIREVGAGPTTWMPTEPHPSLAMQIRGEPGTNVTLRGWAATGPGAADPAPTLPLGVDTPLDVGTQWTMLEMPTLQLHADGTHQFIVPPEVGNRLVVMAAVSEHGGSATWVLGFGGNHYHFEEVLNAPGSEGNTQLALTGPTGRPATVHAISTEGLETTVGGSRALATGLLLPDGADHWAGGIDGQTTRAEGVQGYHLLAWFLDGSGAYLGHAVTTRGLDVMASGVPGGVQVTLQHIHTVGERVDPANTIAATMTATVDGAQVGSRTVHIPQGGRISHTFPAELGPSSSAHVVVDTGDLYFETTQSVAAPDDGKSGKLTPGPLPFIALLGALLLRKREI